MQKVLPIWVLDPDGFFWRYGVDGVKWLVTDRDDGWYWHTMIGEVRSSSLFGPFSSFLAAIADCETAHQ